MITEKTKKTRKAIGPQMNQLQQRPRLKLEEQQHNGLWQIDLHVTQQKQARTQLSVMVQQVVHSTIARNIRSNVVYMARTKISSKFLSQGQFRYND
mmetsp:Transcript_54171/g.100068  ORF Transcript_54171/g.100068 Transcript_54171/m.100068 type:complete len:96 (+) Transcript_54171:1179-1466(+)